MWTCSAWLPLHLRQGDDALSAFFLHTQAVKFKIPSGTCLYHSPAGRLLIRERLRGNAGLCRSGYPGPRSPQAGQAWGSENRMTAVPLPRYRSRWAGGNARGSLPRWRTWWVLFRLWEQLRNLPRWVVSWGYAAELWPGLAWEAAHPGASRGVESCRSAGLGRASRLDAPVHGPCMSFHSAAKIKVHELRPKSKEDLLVQVRPEARASPRRGAACSAAGEPPSTRGAMDAPRARGTCRLFNSRRSQPPPTGQGAEAGAVRPARGQGHRRRRLQAGQDQGGAQERRARADGAEAEPARGAQGGVRGQEVHAPGPARQEDARHPPPPDRAPGAPGLGLCAMGWVGGESSSFLGRRLDGTALDTAWPAVGPGRGSSRLGSGPLLERCGVRASCLHASAAFPRPALLTQPPPPPPSLPQANAKTEKQLKKERAFPRRKFAVKA